MIEAARSATTRNRSSAIRLGGSPAARLWRLLVCCRAEHLAVGDGGPCSARNAGPRSPRCHRGSEPSSVTEARLRRAGRALWDSLRSNAKHCRVTYEVFGHWPSPGWTTAVSSAWTIHDADGKRRGNRERGREGKLGLGISRVELALISRTGRSPGAAGSSVWGDDGGWAPAQDPSRSRAPLAMESVSGLAWIGRGETRAFVLLVVGITGTVATAVTGWAVERSPTSPGRRRGCEGCATSCCCRTWGRPTLRRGLRWLDSAR